MNRKKQERICDACGGTFNPRGTQKRCSDECKRKGELKRQSEYHRNKLKDDDFRARRLAYFYDWKKKNEERLKQYRKERQKKIAAKHSEYQAIYRTKNREKIRLNHYRWRQRNKEKLALAKKKYRSSEYGKQKTAEYTKQREKTDAVFLMVRRIRARIKIALLKSGAAKARKTIEYLGMTGEQFMTYLLQHPSNTGDFTRENFGKAWVVDHIRPIASFDLSDEKQVKLAFHYANCQPLSPEQNASKGCLWNGLYWQNGKGRKLPYCSLHAG